MAKVARGKALVAKLRADPKVRDPEALAAELGRRKKLRQTAKKAGKAVKKIAGKGLSDKLTPGEHTLFHDVTGKDLPNNPQVARELLHNGDFENADQDALVALDDKLIAAAQLPDPFEEAGLNKDKSLGQFDNPDRAGRWAAGIYGDYMRELPDEQRVALGYYKRGGYQPINSSLRRHGGDLDGVKAQPANRAQRHPVESIEPMDEAFNNAPTTDRPIALTRFGLPPEVEHAFRSRDEVGLLGQVFGDEAFGSTTMNPDWRGSGVGGGALAHLLLPKGSKVLPIDGLANLKGAPEDELLLPRGTRYRITGVRRDPRDAPVIEGEIIVDE